MFFHGSTAPFGDPPRQADHFRSRAPLRSITRLARFPRFLVAYAASLMSCMPRQFSFPGVANSAIHLSFGDFAKIGRPTRAWTRKTGLRGRNRHLGRRNTSDCPRTTSTTPGGGTLKLGVVSRWNHWERNLERPVTSRVFIARRATNWAQPQRSGRRVMKTANTAGRQP